MLNLLLGPVTDIIGSSIKGFVATKKAKAELKVKKIEAETSLMEKKIQGEVDWDIQAIKNTQGSWKDEYLTIIFSIRLLLCFLPFTVEYVERGFDALSKTPDWYKYTLGVIVSASFGIKGASKFFKK